MAPELFTATGEPAPTSDVYALGLVLFELVTKLSPIDLPKDDTNPMRTMSSVVAAHQQSLPRIRAELPRLSPKVRQLIEKTTALSPSSRLPNGAAILEALSPSAEARAFSGPQIERQAQQPEGPPSVPQRQFPESKSAEVHPAGGSSSIEAKDSRELDLRRQSLRSAANETARSSRAEVPPQFHWMAIRTAGLAMFLGAIWGGARVIVLFRTGFSPDEIENLLIASAVTGIVSFGILLWAKQRAMLFRSERASYPRSTFGRRLKWAWEWTLWNFIGLLVASASLTPLARFSFYFW